MTVQAPDLRWRTWIGTENAEVALDALLWLGAWRAALPRRPADFAEEGWLDEEIGFHA